MKFHKAGKKPAKKTKSHGTAKKATKRRVKNNPAPSRRFHSKRRVRRNPSGLDLKSFGVSVAGFDRVVPSCARPILGKAFIWKGANRADRN